MGAGRLSKGRLMSKQIVYRGGALTLASVGLVVMLTRWEPAKDAGLVYADRLADGLPTVCNGITRHVSPYPVIVGERWTPSKCALAEEHAIAQTQMRLLHCFKVQISQGQFDAFSSFAWNVGFSAACKSRAMTLTNSGQAAQGCDALAHRPDGEPAWSYAAGRYVFGLYQRRLDERRLCLSGLTGV